MFDILSFLENHAEIESSNNHEVYLKACPWCGLPDKHKTSFGVSRDKPVFNCFRCGKSGHWSWLMAKVARITIDQARERLGEDIGLSVSAKSEKREANIEFPPETAATLRAIKYLHDRDIEEKTIRGFELYFCGKGKFKDRIVIPVIFNGEWRTFQARAVRDDMEPRYDGPYDSPVAELWYNWDRWEEGQEIVIVEGPFDVMKLHQNGVYAICALGKNISDTQINLLTSRISSITLMPDPDRAGKLSNEWHFLSRYLDVKIVPLMGTKDPGDMNKEETQEAMKTQFDNMKELEWHRFNKWKERHIAR